MVRIFAVGANGGVGVQVVRQALDAGHYVTAYVRTTTGLPVDSDRLRIVRGDVIQDTTPLQEALKGHDAVVSTLGSGLAIKGRRDNKIMTAAIGNLTQAMSQAGVERVVAIFAYGAGATRAHAPGWLRVVGSTLLRKDYADLAGATDALAASSTDWTACYFGSLNDHPLTGAYTTKTTLGAPEHYAVPRADVAHFLLRCLAEHQYSRASVVLSGPPR